MRKAIACGLIVLATAVNAQIPDPSATASATAAVSEADPESVDRLPFLIEPEYRMVVRVEVPGSTKLSFLVDTAAERSAVSHEVADRLNFPKAGSVSIVSFGGIHSVGIVSIPELRFSKTVRTNLQAMTFDDDVIGADGFLGVDALHDKRVEFDFVNERMTIQRAGSVGPSPSNRSVVVRVGERNGRLIFSNVAVNRIKAEALLDTGSSLTIGNMALRDALEARGKLGKTVPVMILAITGEVIRADYGFVKEVTLPDIVIHNMPIAFSTVEPFKALGLEDRPALLLGMDALRAFGGIKVDFRHRKVLFASRIDPNATQFQIVGNRPADF